MSNTMLKINQTQSEVNFIGVNDHLQITPIQGRRKELILNRSRYQIIPSGDFTFSQNDFQISLPSTKESYQYELAVDQEQNIFTMKTISGGPFLLNGNYTYHALLSECDQIKIGYNILKFQTKESANSNSTKIELSDRVVKSNVSILLLGETGTGKSYLARKIHEESNLRGNFVHINISSFGAGVLESELFGHVKGSFTGAISDKKGAILEANGGTLFIDEIDSLPIDIQTKLLLFLDTKEVRPVGGWNSKVADVRMIFAAGRPLEQLVSAGTFRKDFYYRIKAGVDVNIKSLRNDPKKVQSICKEEANRLGFAITDELIAFYQKCEWPGNIRQLKSHLVKKSYSSKSFKLVLDDFDKALAVKDQASDLPSTLGENIQTLEEIKLKYIESVWLKMGKDNIKSSKLLDITPNTLRAAIRKLYPAMIASN